MSECDVIGGFPFNDPLCGGCGKELLIENAWMTDGCPCNSPLGCNSMNEHRWRLLMQLQQQSQFAAPGDEATPLDEAFLRSAGFHEDGGVFTICTGGLELTMHEERWSIFDGERVTIPSPKTRGDLRRLVAALGIELKETQA